MTVKTQHPHTEFLRWFTQRLDYRKTIFTHKVAAEWCGVSRSLMSKWSSAASKNQLLHRRDRTEDSVIRLAALMDESHIEEAVIRAGMIPRGLWEMLQFYPTETLEYLRALVRSKHGASAVEHSKVSYIPDTRVERANFLESRLALRGLPKVAKQKVAEDADNDTDLF